MGRSKNKARTAVRKCATCGEPFTWTSSNPKRRFCDPVCKARWWRVSNSDATQSKRQPATLPLTTDSTGNTGTTSAASTARTASADLVTTANAVTHAYDPYVSGYAGQQTPSTAQSCPNCHQPVAVINLLVIPAAAYVNTPSRSVTDREQSQ
jgi:endogenous inhibitor of DNA gyrase (YacG/DUF329 family)